MTVGSRIVALAIIAAAGSAHAQAPSAADLAFKKGREMLKAGNYAEACVQFEASQAADPQLGTLYNIGQCDEQIGKLASALAAYRDVVARDTNATRKQAAAARVAALEPRVAKLVVEVGGQHEHLAITLDGHGGKRTIDAGAPVEVDLGSTTVTVRADGARDFTQKVQIAAEGKTEKVTAVLEPGAPSVVANDTAAAPAASEPQDAAPGPSHRRRNAVIVAAGGGIALAGGLVFGLLAHGKWNDAKSLCPDGCVSQGAVTSANSDIDSAHLDANLSTGLVLAGAALAAVGVYLYLTAPSETAPVVSARFDATGATVGLTARF